MFAICIEASHSRGLGHLYRSLNLAEYLALRGNSCVFVMNNNESSVNLVRSKGFSVEVVDIHNLTSNWETWIAGRYPISHWINDRLDTTLEHAQRIRNLRIRLVTFDDQGPGSALADLHVAALVFSAGEPLGGAQVLQGVDYAILNPEIEKYRRQRDGINSDLLVTMGGSDTYGVSVEIASLLIDLGRPATIVIGPAFAHLDELNELLASHADRYIVKKNVPSLIAEMFAHDLAITGGGLTALEAAASGLPTIIVANELLEIPVGRMLELLGCSSFAGHHESIDVSLLTQDVDIVAMSRAGMEKVGLNGGRLVAEAITSL